MQIELSPLGHTWIIDLDGTVFKHNGHLSDDGDTPLPKSLDLIRAIPDKDMIIFITSRPEEYREVTLQALRDNDIRFDEVIFSAPYGERVLINDIKPSGLPTSYAINVSRDKGIDARIAINDRL